MQTMRYALLPLGVGTADVCVQRDLTLNNCSNRVVVPSRLVQSFRSCRISGTLRSDNVWRVNQSPFLAPQVL